MLLNKLWAHHELLRDKCNATWVWSTRNNTENSTKSYNLLTNNVFCCEPCKRGSSPIKYSTDSNLSAWFLPHALASQLKAVAKYTIERRPIERLSVCYAERPEANFGGEALVTDSGDINKRYSRSSDCFRNLQRKTICWFNTDVTLAL